MSVQRIFPMKFELFRSPFGILDLLWPLMTSNLSFWHSDVKSFIFVPNKPTFLLPIKLKEWPFLIFFSEIATSRDLWWPQDKLFRNFDVIYVYYKHFLDTNKVKNFTFLYLSYKILIKSNLWIILSIIEISERLHNLRFWGPASGGFLWRVQMRVFWFEPHFSGGGEFLP